MQGLERCGERLFTAIRGYRPNAARHVVSRRVQGAAAEPDAFGPHGPGVIIGVSAVICTIAIGEGASFKIREAISSIGDNWSGWRRGRQPEWCSHRQRRYQIADHCRHARHQGSGVPHHARLADRGHADAADLRQSELELSGPRCLPRLPAREGVADGQRGHVRRHRRARSFARPLTQA